MFIRYLVFVGFIFYQDFGDFCMVGIEGIVEFEAVSIIQKGFFQREQYFLDLMRKSVVSLRFFLFGNISRMQRGVGICLIFFLNQYFLRLLYSFFLFIDGLKLFIRKYLGLLICEIDVGFCFLSNYSGDVIGFLGLCF